MAKSYHVYITASISRVLYIGVTSDLLKRVHQHKEGVVESFTKSYRADRLVYFEETSDVHAAIAQEKQLKGWRREKKVALIDAMNPKWNDLYLDFTG
jgi:putative endonuclease